MPSPRKTNSSVEKTFEDAIKRLEEIVSILEVQSPALDESLALYEEGKSLLSSCLHKLETAEQKLKVLSQPEGS